MIDTDLARELTILLNRHSREDESNTPDYILAKFMLECLDAYEMAFSRNREWTLAIGRAEMSIVCESVWPAGSSLSVQCEKAKLTADLAACRTVCKEQHETIGALLTEQEYTQRKVDQLRALLAEVRGCEIQVGRKTYVEVMIPRELWERLG